MSTGQAPPIGNSPSSQLQAALDRLDALVIDGLRHGFFDYSIACEMVGGRKRRLVIKAGKSHQFTIPEEELER